MSLRDMARVRPGFSSDAGVRRDAGRAHAVVVGSVELEPVLDAVGLLAEYTEAYPGVDPEEWEPYRQLYPELFAGPTWRLPVKVYLLRTEESTILVDTGVGPPGLWEWTAEDEGRLPEALDACGLHRDDIDVVFLTHLHIDHVGWNADLEGVPLFPTARYVVHRDAFEYARKRKKWPHIARCVEALADRFELLAGDTKLAPDISAFDAPGHYPGHMALRIGSQAARAVILGDVAPHPALLDRPEWEFAFDEDSAANAPIRRKLVAELVDSDALLVCGHYPGSGIGRAVTRDGNVVWETV